MDLKEIRRLVIIALFSDDELMEQFVLKGGNALDIIHGVGTRSSVDIDLSIAADFTDLEKTSQRINHALTDRFAAAGYVVFDYRFAPRPTHVREGQSPRWGGYQVEFKLVPRGFHDQHGQDLAKLRRNATLIDANNKRIFKVDISKFEFCEAKQEAELDSYTIYVYSLPMIAIEKLRAICQQMPEYPLRPYAKPRARDFYDIYATITAGGLKLTTPENVELVRHIFAAKEVPLALLGLIRHTQDFHAVDWAAVEQSVAGDLQDFAFYFNFVVGLVTELEAVGIE